MPPQKPIQINFDPNSLMNPFLNPMGGLKSPPVALPREPDNRKLGVDPLGDLIDAITSNIPFVNDPLDPHSSQASQLGGIFGAALPLGINSRLQEAIMGIKSKAIHANKLLSLAQQVPEEAEAIGLTKMAKNALASNNPVLDTQAVKDYVSQNPMRVGETLFENKPDPRAQEYKDLINKANDYGLKSLSDEEFNRLEDLNQAMHYGTLDQNNTTKYKQYTLPGAVPGSYSERVLSWDGPFDDPYNRPGRVDSPLVVQAKSNPNTADLVQYIPKDLQTVGDGPQLLPTDPNQPNHAFSVPNALVWSRGDTRETPFGNIRLIDEIQSDWHQEGASKGYRDQALIDKLKTNMQTSRDAYNNYLSSPEFDPTNIDDSKFGPLHNAYQDAFDAWYGQKSDLIPDAPFKSNWPDLALKREIYDAAQNGLNGVAWNPGQVHNARWQQLIPGESMAFDPENGLLRVYTRDNSSRDFLTNNGQSLEQLVGKSAAQQLRDAGPNMAVPVGDINIGGQGTADFYNNVLPRKAQKIAANFGGQVEPLGTVDPMKQSAPTFGDPTAQGTSIMGIKLTPEMRKAILEKGFYALTPLLAATLGGMNFLHNDGSQQQPQY